MYIMSAQAINSICLLGSACCCFKTLKYCDLQYFSQTACIRCMIACICEFCFHSFCYFMDLTYFASLKKNYMVIYMPYMFLFGLLWWMPSIHFCLYGNLGFMNIYVLVTVANRCVNLRFKYLHVCTQSSLTSFWIIFPSPNLFVFVSCYPTDLCHL